METQTILVNAVIGVVLTIVAKFHPTFAASPKFLKVLTVAVGCLIPVLVLSKGHLTGEQWQGVLWATLAALGGYRAYETLKDDVTGKTGVVRECLVKAAEDAAPQAGDIG